MDKEATIEFQHFCVKRIALIQNLTSLMSWHYLTSNSNPADVLSRGAWPEELKKFTVWTKRVSSAQRPATTEFIADLHERKMYKYKSIIGLLNAVQLSEPILQSAANFC